MTPNEPATTHTHTQTRKRTYSFEIGAAKRNASEKTAQTDTLFSSTSHKQLVAQQSSDPMLPKFEPCRDETCRGSTSLQNQQIDPTTSEAEIQQIVRQIHDLYLEGPIVDGWLESYPQAEQPGEQLIGYRLCGLDATGQKWSHHCPVNQLVSVSIAIARYQKLQQLLERIANWSKAI